VTDRIAEAHQVLAALLHAGVASDPQSGPDGFRRARELGLVDGTHWLTPQGRAVLESLGARKGEGRAMSRAAAFQAVPPLFRWVVPFTVTHQPRGVREALHGSDADELLSEDDGPIRLVPEKVRDAWGPPRKKAYGREQYERDKRARSAR
jgi:hypothetical protein